MADAGFLERDMRCGGEDTVEKTGASGCQVRRPPEEEASSAAEYAVSLKRSVALRPRYFYGGSRAVPYNDSRRRITRFFRMTTGTLRRMGSN